MLDNLNTYNNANKPQFGNTNANFGMTVQQGNSQLSPPMQAEIDTEMLKQAANDNFIANRVNAFSEIDPMLQAGVAVPVWLAVNQAMDVYLKHCGGEYGKSIPGRIGNFGDKVTNLVSNNSVAKFFNNIFGKGKNFSKKYIYNNSALLRAFDKTPSQPELGIVKAEFEGIKGKVANDIPSAWNAFVQPSKSAKDLDCLGATKEQILKVENLMKNAATLEEKKLILQGAEFRLLNPKVTDTEIRNFKYNTSPAKRAEMLKNLKIKALGFKDAKEFEFIIGNVSKNIDRVIEILKKSRKDIFARVNWSDKNTGTKVLGQLFGRKVTFQESLNKMLSSLGTKNQMHTSKLGKWLAQTSNMVTEGATGRFIGGKLMAFVQAYFLAEALIMANKQETTGDKLKSAAERITELIGFFVFIGPSVKLMYKIGGLQYSGMSAQQIEQYRNAVKEFNDKVVNGVFKTKQQYKDARKVLKSQFRPKTKNPLVWATRKAADILTVGLEQVRPYTKIKQKQVNLCITELSKNPKQYLKDIAPRLKDFACNPKYWIKQMAGYPIRFLVPMALFIPFFNKIAVKGCHMIFGKPKYSILDKEKIEKAQKEQDEEQKQIQRLIAAQTAQPKAITPIETVNGVSTSNMLNKYNTASPQYTQINHTGNLLDKNVQQNVTETPPEAGKSYKYIPSPEGVKVVQKNSTEADLALKRADEAEKRAIAVLSGKFS